MAKELGTYFYSLAKTLGDTQIHKQFKDLYNASDTTYQIRGAGDTRGIITTFRIPKKLPFGSSELRSLEYLLYSDSFTIGESRTPLRVAAYKFRNEDDMSTLSSKLTSNTGIAKGTKPTTTGLTNPVLFFSATSDSQPMKFFSESFNGIDNNLAGDL